jgi:hypothetical protein
MNRDLHIKRILDEYYVKQKKDHSEVEKILNRIMPKKYDWWKRIFIDDISYSELSNHLTIYGVLEVDEEWGANQWKEFYYSKPFPGNEGWDEGDPVLMGDIISDVFGNELRDYLSKLLMMITNYGIIRNVRINDLPITFV